MSFNEEDFILESEQNKTFESGYFDKYFFCLVIFTLGLYTYLPLH